MVNLKFIKIDQDPQIYYQIYNKKKQYLGQIMKKKVGRFQHWCFCPDLDDDMAVGDLYFTNGCLREIVEFITTLYPKPKKITDKQVCL